MRYYSLYKLNQVKNYSLKLLNYAEMLFEDMEKIYEDDETICRLWLSYYVFMYIDKGKGTFFSLSLYDYIHSHFSNYKSVFYIGLVAF